MRSLFAGVLWLVATQAFAASCHNAAGTPTDIHYDLSNSFDGSNNHLYKVVTRSEKSAWIGVRAICPAGTRQTHTYRSYVTRFPMEFTAHGYRYLQISPHLQAAMRLRDSYAGEFYPPENYIRMGQEENVAKQLPFGVMDSQLLLKLRVTERFMNRVTIPQQTLFTVYVTTDINDPLTSPVYTISLGGVVEVPQRCEVNAGQVVEFDFGDIRAGLFSEAGAGNRPRGVTPQSRTVSINCTNVHARAYISLRLEAERAKGHILVSDNPDLGFVVANEWGQPFKPNNIFSLVPLELDKNAAAHVAIRAWPVSVTGQKPAEGPFSARGFLRVEYN